MKRILFLGGGFLNDQGPFEPNSEVLVPDDQAVQLLALGLATLIPDQSTKPITLTITTSGGAHV